MHELKLHTKTTMLVSAITLSVLVALLLIISVKVVDLVSEEERDTAELHAASLAGHIGASPDQPDEDEIRRTMKLVRNVHQLVSAVRFWQLTDGQFTINQTNADATASTVMPPPVAEKLRQQQPATATSAGVLDLNDTIYRAFAPVVRDGRLIGAIEVSTVIDDVPTIVARSLGTALLLALAAVALIGFATYALFREMIYLPIDQLLHVIARTKAGEFDVQTPERRPDELGKLSQEFNDMLGRLHEMTAERERQRETLQQRVQAATQQLQERNADLEAMNLELWRTSRRLTQLERLAAAGQTAAQFAHEVGTPLNLISCHAQLLQAELAGNPASAKERSGIIIEQTERIERIVRGMLDRTRTKTAEFAPVELNKLLKHIVDATAPTLAERQVKLALALDDTVPPIAGAPDKLQQVFINLINNALDAMTEGGELTISTAWQPAQNGQPPNVGVSIGDTGCGMTPEVQAHIFDPLYTTKERGKGTGLGLVVVSQVVNEHGGSLRVESAPGVGSRFHLAFPTTAALQAHQG